jgi:hypothetical protein
MIGINIPRVFMESRKKREKDAPIGIGEFRGVSLII